MPQCDIGRLHQDGSLRSPDTAALEMPRVGSERTVTVSTSSRPLIRPWPPPLDQPAAPAKRVMAWPWALGHPPGCDDGPQPPRHGGRCRHGGEERRDARQGRTHLQAFTACHSSWPLAACTTGTAGSSEYTSDLTEALQGIGRGSRQGRRLWRQIGVWGPQKVEA